MGGGYWSETGREGEQMPEGGWAGFELGLRDHLGRACRRPGCGHGERAHSHHSAATSTWCSEEGCSCRRFRRYGRPGGWLRSWAARLGELTADGQAEALRNQKRGL